MKYLLSGHDHFLPSMYIENLPVPTYCYQLNINGKCIQEIKRMVILGRAAMKEVKITKSKGVLLETKAEIIYTLTFSIIAYEYQVGQ